MHVIGEESSQHIDKIPPQYQVIVTHCPKYGCRALQHGQTAFDRDMNAECPSRLARGLIAGVAEPIRPTRAVVAPLMLY
jgi:transposase